MAVGEGTPDFLALDEDGSIIEASPGAVEKLSLRPADSDKDPAQASLAELDRTNRIIVARDDIGRATGQ